MEPAPSEISEHYPLTAAERARYRADDQVNISTTLMGDTSVEISSGSGDSIDANHYLLGHSGDFFTSLSRSSRSGAPYLRSSVVIP